MALRFDLGPFEELHIGKCVIKNSHEHSLFVIDGKMPILKGKDVLSEGAVQSSLEGLYYCVQQMYLEEATEKYQGRYLQLAAQSMREDPLLSAVLEAVDQLVRVGESYKALKRLKKLIRAEAFSVHKSPSQAYVPRVNGWKQVR